MQKTIKTTKIYREKAIISIRLYGYKRDKNVVKAWCKARKSIKITYVSRGTIRFHHPVSRGTKTR